jgi:hypothetical protein
MILVDKIGGGQTGGHGHSFPGELISFEHPFVYTPGNRKNQRPFFALIDQPCVAAPAVMVK